MKVFNTKVFDLERSLNKIKKIQKSFKKRKRKSEVESDTKSDKKRRVEIRDPTPESKLHHYLMMRDTTPESELQHVPPVLINIPVLGN